MAIKCKACGFTGSNVTSCPDCGNPNLVPSAGQTAEASAATPPAVVAANPVAELTMPTITIATDVTSPVVVKIKLWNGETIELREGKSWSIASQWAKKPVDMKVEVDDEHFVGVSSEPLVISVRDGKTYVKGGGGNGFKVITEVKYTADKEIEISSKQKVSIGKDTVMKIM